MVELSEHTKLINIVASLATTRIFKFSSTKEENPLWNLGYRLSYIEFSLANVKPDVILTSRGLSHSLVIDCKSRKANPSQTEKYITLRENPKSLLNYITVDSPNDYYIDPAFLSFHKELCGDSNVVSSKIPVLTVHSNTNKTSELLLECNDFIVNRVYNDLRNIFPLKLPEHVVKSYLRAHYIDFGINDPAECEFFVSRVLKVLISQITISNKSPVVIAIETLSQKMYSQLWNFIGKSKQREINSHIKNVIKRFRKKSKRKIKEKIKLENNLITIDINPNKESDVRNFADQLKKVKANVVYELCKGQNTLTRYFKHNKN